MSTNMFGVPVEGFAQKSKEAATAKNRPRAKAVNIMVSNKSEIKK